MSNYRLLRTSTITKDLEEVFSFFADPVNLETITPPWLRFQIITPKPIAMKVGARIDYRLRLRGIPLNWTSEITVWEPPHRFVDMQVKGPYRKWVHEHSFRQVENGTEVTDQVDYVSPGGPLVHRFLVRPDVEKIFDYREVQLRRHFAQESLPADK